jgi:valyl-tRNA synthetase
VFLLVRGVVDFDKEIQKLNTKMSKIQNSLSSLQKQMALPDYEEKVKQEIRDMNSHKVIAVFCYLIYSLGQRFGSRD